MILTCPACATQYVVKDGAIPDGGRQVRCAACKHSWHQDADDASAAEAGDQPPPVEEDEASVGAADPGDGAADGAEDGAAAGDEVDAPPGYAPVDPLPPPADPPLDPAADSAAEVDEDDGAALEAGDQWRPPEQSDEFSPFARDEEEEEERRSPMARLLLAALVVALLGAAFWFLAPIEWKARVGLAEGPATPLQLMMTHSDRQRLASGNELLEITGRVINPTEQTHSVPPIQAQLRSRSGELVYSWTIRPPASTLAPGESRTFNSAEVNVPAGGDELTISLGPPRA